MDAGVTGSPYRVERKAWRGRGGPMPVAAKRRRGGFGPKFGEESNPAQGVKVQRAPAWASS